MPRKPQVAVEPRADGRWAVQTNGTQRADSLHARYDSVADEAVPKEVTSNESQSGPKATP